MSIQNRESIVVIEDDRDTGDVMEIALSMEGYSVQVVADENDALDTISASRPDAVLLDYYGVTGDLKKFIARIREIHRHLSIILVTGARNPEEKARALGLKQFLAKPFDCKDLRRVLKTGCASSNRPSVEKLEFSIF